MIISNKRAQSSMEYLLIIGLALFFIVPSFYFFYTNTQRSTDLAIANQVERMGHEIISSSSRVYSYGRNAKVTVELTMPPNVKNVRLMNPNELIFTISSGGRDNTLVFFSEIPLYYVDGCLESPSEDQSFGFRFANPGRKNLRLISCGQNVSIWFS